MDTSTPSLPVFSVLVANHNHAHLVARAIDSVLAQDYPAALREVVVVDDGSTDDSVQVLAPYAQVPGVQVVQQPNRGQTAAYAAALAAARGDFICLLDADDTCLPNKLRALAEFMRGLDVDRESLFICHDLLILQGADGAAIGERWFDVVGVRRFGRSLPIGAASQFFPFSVTSGMVFGRELLQRAFAEIPLWEWPMGTDGVLGHVAMLLAGEVQYVQEALGSYVVHGNNNFAAIEGGHFRHKPVWHGRWPRKLRFLELLLDSLPLGPRERAERAAYLGRVEHAVRAVPLARQHTQALLSVVIDVPEGAPAGHLAQTMQGFAAQSVALHELLVVAAEAVDLPSALRGRVVPVPAGSQRYARWRAGAQAAQGGYLCFMEAGDLPERRFVERHLQSHRYGHLPMLTACDLRLLDAGGAVQHVSMLATAQPGWGTAAAQVAPFATGLRDWPLGPPPALVMRRSPFLDAFFAADHFPLPQNLLGWLLAHYLLQLGGAARMAENLVDVRLPAGATPNASWLSQFVDRHGPLAPPDWAACAQHVFEVHARVPPPERAFLSEAWEARFVRWLVQNGGAEMPVRIDRVARQAGPAGWSARIQAHLKAPATR